MKVKNVKFYVFNNTTILGTLNTEDMIVTGLETDKPEFVDYMEAKAMGGLTVIKVNDLNSPMVRELQDDDKLELASLNAKYKAAKKRAKNWLHQQVFKAMLEGK